MKPQIPDGNNELRIADRERAGQMDCVSTSQRVTDGKLPSVRLDGRTEVDRTDRSPVAAPVDRRCA